MDRPVSIIGAPTDYGANRRGVDMGPSAIRYAGLADELEAANVSCLDAGDVTAPHAEAHDTSEPDDVENARFLAETKDVTWQLTELVAEVITDGRFPLVLGGDHSVAIGTLRGASRNATIGAIWFDAHGDFNTPTTSPSGNIHGMPLAATLGVGDFADTEWANAPNLIESNVALVGLRDVDGTERDAINNSDVTAFTMSDIDDRGITAVVEDAIEIATDGVDGFHVSLDLDWLDPNEAPGVGTPVRGGVTYREAHHALELVAEHRETMRSLDVVEVNPILDTHNATAELATELVGSALGKRII